MFIQPNGIPTTRRMPRTRHVNSRSKADKRTRGLLFSVCRRRSFKQWREMLALRRVATKAVLFFLAEVVQRRRVWFVLCKQIRIHSLTGVWETHPDTKL